MRDSPGGQRSASVTDMKSGGALAALIGERHDEGWSYRKMAALTGGGLTHSQIQKWHRAPTKKAPTQDQLQALARALQMPEDVIFNAAAKDWTTPPQLIKTGADDGSIMVIA